MHMRIAQLAVSIERQVLIWGLNSIFAVVLFNLAINIVEEGGNRSTLVNDLVAKLLT